MMLSPLSGNRRRLRAAWHTCVCESLEQRRLFDGFVAHVNFQPASAPVPAGYVADSGALFADQGNGFTYGWNGPNPNVATARNLKTPTDGIDDRYDTFATLHFLGKGSAWQIAVPDGTYVVDVLVGDPTMNSGNNILEVNQSVLINAKVTKGSRWSENSGDFAVSGGLISLTVPRGFTARVDSISITQIQTATPRALAPATVSTAAAPATDSLSQALVWTTAANAPQGLAEAQSVSVNGKLYVFGGYNITTPDYQPTSASEVYDPTTNHWTTLAPIPAPETHMAVVSDGTNIYVAGGYGYDPKTTYQTFAITNVWKYDIASNTWSAFVSLPSPIGAGAMALLGTQLHFFDGVNTSRIGQTEHWVLDLSSSNPQWTNSSSLPFSRNHMTSAVLDGKIYAIGGQATDNDSQTDADVLVWDPNNPNVWTPVASEPIPRSHAVTAVVDDEIIVAGGTTTNDVPINNVTVYDPVTNAWTTQTSLPAARLAAVGGLLGSELVVSTGVGSGGLQSQTWVANIDVSPAAPAITTQPANHTVVSGQPVTFSAAASGNPSPTVQWQVSSDGSTFTNISGATSTSYTFTTSTASNGYGYRAVFTNSQGSATTSAATLTATSPLAGPVVTTQPVSLTAAIGQTVSFSAGASGNPAPAVQWQMSTDGTTFANISGATSTTYTFAADVSQSGYTYRAVFSNSQGSATSAGATLTVSSTPATPTVVLQPVGQSAAAGATVTFSAGANGNPAPTVQWQVSTDGTTFNDVGGATSTNYAFTATAGQDGNLFRAVFTNSQGAATTNSVELTIISPTAIPTITTQPVAQGAIAGQSVSFTAAAIGDPTPTVQWNVSTDQGATFSAIPGATDDTYTFTADASENGYVYEAVYTNSNGSIATNEVPLTVSAEPAAPVVTSQPLGESAVAAQGVSFTAAATGVPTPTVRWQVSTDTGETYTDIPGAISPTLSFIVDISQNGDLFKAVFSNSQGFTTTAPAALMVHNPLEVSPTLGGPISASVVAGQKTPIHQTVSIGNSSGSTFTGNVVATFFLSSNGALSSDAIMLPTSISKRLNLKRGRSVHFPLTLKGIPASTPPGTYYLGVQLTGSDGSTSVGNSISTMTVEAPIVTLGGTVFQLPATEKIGRKKISATITLANTGNVAAAGPLEMTYYASPDASLTDAVVILPAFTRAIRITPGKSEKIHIGGIVLSSVAGTYFLIGQLQPTATFPDLDPASDFFVSKPVTVG